jgi:hypothetical protein
VQLGLFTPHEEGYEFKVIVTNKSGKAKPTLRMRPINRNF